MTETPPVKIEESAHSLLMTMHRDLGVVVERQSEANRRLGIIESRAEKVILLEKDIADLKAEVEKDDTTVDKWKELLIYTPITVVITLAATWAAAKLGLPLVGP